MNIILSQRIDTESTYEDEIFEIYHYPAKYRNQIKQGDTFIYYQGDRRVKQNRYYFGRGVIGKIYTSDSKNYYAEIEKGEKFDNIVPIYAIGGGYIETKGYLEVRKSPKPPWQNSIRPISVEAFNEIIRLSGGFEKIIILENTEEHKSIEELNLELKIAFKNYYLKGNEQGIIDIIQIAKEIAKEKKLF